MTLTHLACDIMLWRHADALPSDNTLADSARPLSKKGLQQARLMGSWLKPHLADEARIITSPALRATQTAVALTSAYQIYPALAPEASLQNIIDTLASIVETDPGCRQLVIVGHQPWLGLLAAQLLQIAESATHHRQALAIQKSAIWWFRPTKAAEDPTFKLLTVQHPAFLTP